MSVYRNIHHEDASMIDSTSLPKKLHKIIKQTTHLHSV